MHRDVPLGARADQEPVAGEEAVGPVRAALALEQPAKHGQRLAGVPVLDLRAVVPADHEVGALAVADLVVDDRVDHDAVLVVGGVEAAAVGERRSARRAAPRAARRAGSRPRCRCRRRSAGCRRRAPRTRARRPGGTGSRAAGRSGGPSGGDPLLEGYVDQPLDLAAGAADEGHRRGVAQPDRPPRPRAPASRRARPWHRAGVVHAVGTLPTRRVGANARLDARRRRERTSDAGRRRDHGRSAADHRDRRRVQTARVSGAVEPARLRW